MRNDERLSAKIRRLHSTVRSVHVDYEDWDEFSEMEQIDYALEWNNELGEIESLEKSYRRDDLTEDQCHAYEALISDLRSVIPILERLKLEKPPDGIL